MTPAEREQKAREWTAKHELAFEKDIVALIDLLAETERETLERVYGFVKNYHFTKMTTTAKPALRTVTDIEDWLRQQAKEVRS